MKKLSLTVLALSTSLLSTFAQPILTEKGAFDNFSTITEYNETSGRGIYWWGQTGVVNSLTRDSGKNQLLVHATQGEYQYVPFGVSFGDDNGALPGGVPYTIDLSSNGKWSFDITNYGTEDLFLRVACQDNQNKMVDCTPIPNPDNLPFDNLNVWAYQVQIQILAGKTVTFKADAPNDAGKGYLNNCDFANGAWGEYGTWDPITQTHIGAAVRYDCDLTKISSISFTPMNAAKNLKDFHALALLNGNFGISNFKVGDVLSGINETSASNEVVSIYPNPAKHSITIKNNLTNATNAAISITNSVGEVVYSNSNPINESIVDISNFQSGLYFVKIGNQIKKVVVQN